LRQEFGQTKIGARRSFIENNAQDLATEDLITPTDMVVTLSHSGYIKSQPLSEYRAQNAAAAASKPPPPKKTIGSISSSLPTHTTTSCASPIVAACTGSKCGKCLQGSRGSRGRPIVNMFPLQEGEKINVVLPLTGDMRSFPADHYVFMGTSMGTGEENISG
jgi:DNA gyrase subunit A